MRTVSDVEGVEKRVVTTKVCTEIDYYLYTVHTILYYTYTIMQVKHSQKLSEKALTA